MLELTNESSEALNDFFTQLGQLPTVMGRFQARFLNTVDRDLSTHIQERFDTGKGWDSLAGGTMTLRRNALKGEPAAAAALYYARHAPRISSPNSSRGFGWTGRVKQLALKPGKLRETGTDMQLVRDFKGMGDTSKRLRYWHFGTDQTVTDTRGQARFLRAAGLHVRVGSKLHRPARPIYDWDQVKRHTEKLAKQFQDMLAEAFGDTLTGTTKIVN